MGQFRSTGLKAALPRSEVRSRSAWLSLGMLTIVGPRLHNAPSSSKHARPGVWYSMHWGNILGCLRHHISLDYSTVPSMAHQYQARFRCHILVRTSLHNPDCRFHWLFADPRKAMWTHLQSLIDAESYRLDALRWMLQLILLHLRLSTA